TADACSSTPNTSAAATSHTATPPHSTRPKGSPVTTCSSSAPPACTANPATSRCLGHATRRSCTPPPKKPQRSANAVTRPVSRCRPNTSATPTPTSSAPSTCPKPN